MASLQTVPRICDAAAHRRLTATRLWIKPARLRDRRCASRGEASPVLAVARTGLSDGGASSHLIVFSSHDLGHKHLKLYAQSCLDMTLSSALSDHQRRSLQIQNLLRCKFHIKRVDRQTSRAMTIGNHQSYHSLYIDSSACRRTYFLFQSCAIWAVFKMCPMVY